MAHEQVPHVYWEALVQLGATNSGASTQAGPQQQPLPPVPAPQDAPDLSIHSAHGRRLLADDDEKEIEFEILGGLADLPSAGHASRFENDSPSDSQMLRSLQLVLDRALPHREADGRMSRAEISLSRWVHECQLNLTMFDLGDAPEVATDVFARFLLYSYINDASRTPYMSSLFFLDLGEVSQEEKDGDSEDEEDEEEDGDSEDEEEEEEGDSDDDDDDDDEDEEEDEDEDSEDESSEEESVAREDEGEDVKARNEHYALGLLMHTKKERKAWALMDKQEICDIFVCLAPQFGASRDWIQQTAKVLAKGLNGVPLPANRPEGWDEFPVELHMTYDIRLPLAINIGRFLWPETTSREEFISKFGPIGEAWYNTITNLSIGMRLVCAAIDHPGPVDNKRTWNRLRARADVSSEWDSMPQTYRDMIRKALTATNNLTLISVMLEQFFEEGELPAGYCWCMMQRAAMQGSKNVLRLLIPAPCEFWERYADFDFSRLAASLVLELACPDDQATNTELHAWVKRQSLASITATQSASLGDAIEIAKKSAKNHKKTTVIGVHLVDKGHRQLAEDGTIKQGSHVMFEHWLVVGVCPEAEGFWIWQADGPLGSYTLLENDKRQDPKLCLMNGAQMNRFTREWEEIAVPKVRAFAQ